MVYNKTLNSINESLLKHVLTKLGEHSPKTLVG